MGNVSGILSFKLAEYYVEPTHGYISPDAAMRFIRNFSVAGTFLGVVILLIFNLLVNSKFRNIVIQKLHLFSNKYKSLLLFIRSLDNYMSSLIVKWLIFYLFLSKIFYPPTNNLQIIHYYQEINLFPKHLMTVSIMYAINYSIVRQSQTKHTLIGNQKLQLSVKSVILFIFSILISVCVSIFLCSTFAVTNLIYNTSKIYNYPLLYPQNLLFVSTALIFNCIIIGIFTITSFQLFFPKSPKNHYIKVLSGGLFGLLAIFITLIPNLLIDDYLYSQPRFFNHLFQGIVFGLVMNAIAVIISFFCPKNKPQQTQNTQQK
ncbi:MAG: hypothetical protein F6K62_05000 [Sphaerospermopsis sp. SIO1G2]|nr:hypothetical protein [Sphaerospermopsis sp. SIO1G1]NET70374.1 hypothetical protein [Sphaerospermopsis sp. SIO1G2]